MDSPKAANTFFYAVLLLIKSNWQINSKRFGDCENTQKVSKVPIVLTSSIKTFLESPRFAFQGMYFILYGTVHKNLGKGVDVNNSHTRIFIISQSLCRTDCPCLRGRDYFILVGPFCVLKAYILKLFVG